MRKVRNELGYTNVELMVPFVRTLGECRKVIDLLAANGLKRGIGAGADGKGGLRIVMMCELPSNVVLAEQFLEFFDGFSIGSNDLTQLTLGLDRDSGLVAGAFDERDPAVKAMLSTGDPRLPQARQVRRHLRPGPVGPSGFRALADGGGHRQPVAQPRYRGLDLALARRQRGAAGQGFSGCVGPAAFRGSTRVRAPWRACRAGVCLWQARSRP